MKNRSASVTGATGFVGWHVAEALRDAGWSVRAVVRPGNTRPVPEGVAVVPAPLAAVPLASAIDGTEVLIHCAGVIRAATDEAFAAVNVEGTRAGVEAANQVSARFVLISSQAAAGTGTRDRPRVETDAPRPINAYGRSKLAGEEVVRTHATTPWVIVRPSAVYGPRDRGFLPLFRLAKRGLFMLAAPASTAFTLVDVGDLSRAIVLAASVDRAAGETLFVGHPAAQTTEDILRAIAGVSGRAYRPRRIPTLALRVAASVGDLAQRLGGRLPIDRSRLAEFNAEGFVCAVDRARDVLAFTASTSLGEGIERTARWYRQQGWL